MAKHWLPLEANPDILTEYARNLGLPERYSFHDVLSVEEWSLGMIPENVVSILLLFPISSASEEERRTTACLESANSVYYMKQNIGNACGTIAVLHALLNMYSADPSAFDSDSYVARMHAASFDLSGASRGEWLEKDDEIEHAHLAIETMGQSAAPTDNDLEVDTHFVCFLTENNGDHVIELDGRREGPVLRGTVTDEISFPKIALQVIRDEFMARNPSDIRFSLLALCEDV